MTFLLWLAAVVLVIVGIFQVVTGDPLIGVLLIVAGFAVGPGGWSIFRSRGSRV